MIGQTISHYKISEKLGEGGMGTVYKAEDTKLKRTVALKFLPPELTSDPKAKRRFMREAQAASALDHSNIGVIYEVNQSEDKQLFIAMAYYQGHTLQDKIEQGPLPLNDAVNIATQIAQGLAKAHAKGIVHRDIKPANILITEEGEVKIVDFGLAKLAGRTQLTKSGATLGTVAYMSPEQAQGTSVDHRTDIWSLAVVLYEMITGEQPFKGENEIAVLHSMMYHHPDLGSNVPVELEWIVEKGLTKSPDERFQSMREMLSELQTLSEKIKSGQLKKRRPAFRLVRRQRIYLNRAFVVLMVSIVAYGLYSFWTREAKSHDRIPIAVVDFVNETNEKELEGLSVLLITALQQSRRLSVLPRSRMFDILAQISEDKVDRIDEALARQICQKANIKTMATGNVRKFGQLYTIDVKVIDLEKNQYLLATRDQGRGHESILAMIDNLAEKTRKGLNEEKDRIQTTSQKIADVTTTNLQAYQHYFQGEQLLNKLKFLEARAEFEKAIALDSTFGLPYYRLSYISFWRGSEHIDSRSMIKKAMELIDRIPEKERFLVRAEYNRVYVGGWPAAIAVLEEMEKHYPDDKEMMFILGDGAYHTGNYSKALEYLKNVLSIDPTHERALQHLVRTFRDIGDYEQMLETAEQYAAVTAAPEAYSLLANAYAAVGKYEEGIERIKQVCELFPQEKEFISILANFYMVQGKHELAERELVLLIEEGQPSRSKHIGYSGLRVLYNLTGQYRNAIDMCEGEAELYWQEKDTTGAAILHIRKALLIVDGWNDIERGWQEVEKTFAFRNGILPGSYIANLFDLYVYHGDYAIADSLLRIGAVTVNSNRAFFHSVKGECDEAEKYAAKVLNAGEPWRKLFVLYPFAKCKFEAKEFEEALRYLLEFQKFSVSLHGTRARYYVKSFCLLGKVYEALGQTHLAVKNYEKLIDLWKNTDSDLPELIDTKARLAKLKAISAK